MPLQRSSRSQSPQARESRPSLRLAAMLAVTAAACAGCARPGDLASTLAAGRTPADIAQWRTLPPAPALVDVPRPLSEREGEVVVATAIAEHEMRRP